MSTHAAEYRFTKASNVNRDHLDSFWAMGYPPTPTTMSRPMDQRRHLPGPNSPAIRTDDPAAISGAVSTRSRTKKAPLGSDRAPLGKPSTKNDQKDVTPPTAPSGKSRKSDGKTHNKNQRTQRRKPDQLGIDKKQPPIVETQLSPKSHPIERPKARSRKRKTAASSILTPPETNNQLEDSQEDLDEDDDKDVTTYTKCDHQLIKDPRQRKTLERNRAAARKCRVRKRNDESTLSSREQAAEDQNRYLSGTYNSLVAEVYFLKTELLRHTNCNCTLIQEYISNEAKRTVEKMGRLQSDAQMLSSLESPSIASEYTRHTGHMGSIDHGFDNQSLCSAHAVDSSPKQYNRQFVVPANNDTFQPGWDGFRDFHMNPLDGTAGGNLQTDGLWKFGDKQMVDFSTMELPDCDIPEQLNIPSTNIPLHDELWDPHDRTLNTAEHLYNAYV
jgi:hypothetical protein